MKIFTVNPHEPMAHKRAKIYHPPLIPPIKGGKVSSPLLGEGLGEGYFRVKNSSIL